MQTVCNMAAKSDLAKQLAIAKKIVVDYDLALARILLALLLAKKTNNKKQFVYANNSLEKTFKGMVVAAQEQIITEEKEKDLSKFFEKYL